MYSFRQRFWNKCSNKYSGYEDKCDDIIETVHLENQAISLVSQVKNEEVRRCRFGLTYGSLGKGKIGNGG